jgi:uncharacterized protein YbjT (DUF2867 family)
LKPVRESLQSAVRGKPLKNGNQWQTLQDSLSAMRELKRARIKSMQHGDYRHCRDLSGIRLDELHLPLALFCDDLICDQIIASGCTHRIQGTTQRLGGWEGGAMKVLVFGATGMVGQGVLLECLKDLEVELVMTVGRNATGVRDPKLREIVHKDLDQYAGMEESLKGFEACFFCLGVSSNGMKEPAYARITYGYAMAAAETLSRVNPGMTFIYVSGSGTDSSEKGRSMWARVKGRTENALLGLPLNAYMFRPGFIEPLDGIQSKTPSYLFFYQLAGPLMSLLSRILPNQILSTREIGQAMLAVARHGYGKRILETKDIRRVVGPRAEK